MASTNETRPAHVVIIGGGFAGVAVARGLANQNVRVTIVDKHNFHTFLPLLYQVATAGLEPADVAYPIRTIFGHATNIRFRHAQVREVDHDRSAVILEGGAEMAFDHLVVATGATAAYFGIPGASRYAMPLYSLADARRLRNRLLMSLEAADVAAEHANVKLTFVVVGGGPTGVETAGALSELVRIAIRRDGLRIRPEDVRVLLVDLAPRLLTAFPENASRYALRELRSMGVEINFGRSVVEVEEGHIRFDDGERLACAAVIWAAGVTASGTLAHDLQVSPGPGGRARVTPDLRLVDSANVWAVGDAAAVPLNGTEFCPQLAPVAIQSGRHCAEQILRVIAGEPTQDFHYRNKGIMATIGRQAAVAKLPRGGVIKGTLGWLAWLGLHLFYLVGFRNRLRVMINWTWRYFDWPSGPRLIVADAETAD
ncbi:MAG TPA: NAD(P)/FAD-dependent oxidoreductase [Acidimicrobiales bacterium]|nr:NAD(P)/FAD-dependent oxidoreductase [Acidimicrobiales bacterium]